MKLTNYEQDVLNGKYGEGAAMAMEIQVAIGETFDAPRMVPVTRTHVALMSIYMKCRMRERISCLPRMRHTGSWERSLPLTVRLIFSRMFRLMER